MNRIFYLSKKRLKIVAAVLLPVLLFGGAIYGIHCWETYDGHIDEPERDQNQPEYYIDGKKYTLKNDVETVLFLGIDEQSLTVSDTNVNGTQADLLVLYVIDHQSETYTALQINRDTIARYDKIALDQSVSDSTRGQIALSHAYGTGGEDSSENTVNAVSDLLYGVEISHYATIRMDAIPVLNDAIGGVTLELLDDFTDLDESYVKGATVTLKGDEATAYVQYRGQLEDKTNVSRMERQKQYMLAWSSKLFERLSGEEDFSASSLMDLSEYVLTDMSINRIDSLADQLVSYTSCGVAEIQGESVKGEEFMEFHVDEQLLQRQVVDLFYTPVE